MVYIIFNSILRMLSTNVAIKIRLLRMNQIGGIWYFEKNVERLQWIKTKREITYVSAIIAKETLRRFTNLN